MMPSLPFGHLSHGREDIRAVSVWVVLCCIGVGGAVLHRCGWCCAEQAVPEEHARPPVGGLQGGTMPGGSCPKQIHINSWR